MKQLQTTIIIMKYLVTFVVLISCVSNILCLKLLLLFPMPSRSHYILGNALGKGLASAGHEVTLVSAFTDKNPSKNYKEIVINEVFSIKNLTRDGVMKGGNIYEMGNIPAVFTIFMLNYMSGAMTTNFFEQPKVQELLKSDEHFDAVIMEQFFNDAMQIFAYHFKAPLILFSLVGSHRWTNNLIGNPAPPSYVPDIFLSYTSDMNFVQRAYNFLFRILFDLYLNFMLYPNQDAALKKYYPNAPNLKDLQSNISLVLVNSHESISEPVPSVPNMIYIGGFHLNSPKKLPVDLQTFMDNARDGVIYFSMGTNLVPSEMPKEKKDAILKVLGARKEKVLWKWDEKTLDNKPDNIMISKWFPQQAILAHPNCKLFITHGGFGSTTETVYLGVPILAIPIAGDQKLNAAAAASLGYGKVISFPELNENKLAESINELLENPSYRDNVKTRSRIMQDRPIKPMDTAIYWIEYVVRHKGAPHLRVAGINLPFYKYYMLDVLATLLAGLVLLKYLLKKICIYIFCNWKRSKKNNTVETQSKNKKKHE